MLYERFIRVYKDRAFEFRWHAVERNGKKVCESGEGYKNKSDCLDGLRKYAPRRWFGLRTWRVQDEA